MFDLSLPPPLELETSIAPLPDRLRLLAQPPLTACPASGKLDSPKHTRQCRSLCPPQADKNRGVFCFRPLRASWVRSTYRRNNVRVSVRPRRSRMAGERCSAFFCTL